MNGPHLSIIELEGALFPDGVPADESAIMLAHLVLELLVARHGHDLVLGLLVELGDMEACRPDD